MSCRSRDAPVPQANQSDSLLLEIAKGVTPIASELAPSALAPAARPSKEEMDADYISSSDDEEGLPETTATEARRGKKGMHPIGEIHHEGSFTRW